MEALPINEEVIKKSNKPHKTEQELNFIYTNLINQEPFLQFLSQYMPSADPKAIKKIIPFITFKEFNKHEAIIKEGDLAN